MVALAILTTTHFRHCTQAVWLPASLIFNEDQNKQHVHSGGKRFLKACVRQLFPTSASTARKSVRVIKLRLEMQIYVPPTRKHLIAGGSDIGMLSLLFAALHHAR